MPGVADAEKRTQAVQKQQGRKKDKEELLRLITEGRLHEATEHQLETIKLALEIGNILEARIDPEDLRSTLRDAVTEAVAALPVGVAPGTGTAPDPSRPGMKHVSLTDISHKDSGIDISHGESLVEEEEGDEDGSEKLKRLKELKGQK